MEIGPIFRALLHNKTRFFLIALEVALTLAIVLRPSSPLLGPSGKEDSKAAPIGTLKLRLDFGRDTGKLRQSLRRVINDAASPPPPPPPPTP